jgi:hypothetical protein
MRRIVLDGKKWIQSKDLFCKYTLLSTKKVGQVMNMYATTFTDRTVIYLLVRICKVVETDGTMSIIEKEAKRRHYDWITDHELTHRMFRTKHWDNEELIADRSKRRKTTPLEVLLTVSTLAPVR